MNVIFIRGRLTQDPDLRTTPQGKAVCSLNLAVNRYVRGNEKETMFIKVTAWDKVAENCGRHLVKGQDILVQGSASVESWTGKDGKAHASLVVTAKGIEFLSKPRSDADDSGLSYDPDAFTDISPKDIPF